MIVKTGQWFGFRQNANQVKILIWPVWFCLWGRRCQVVGAPRKAWPCLMTIAVSSECIQHKVVNGLAMVQVTHHGRAAGVTGSWHPLQVDAENNLLFDCALFESLETSPEGNIDAERLAIAFALVRVNVHVANHLQVDHVGRIPYLLVVGFKGPTLCSEPSAKLLPIVLVLSEQPIIALSSEQLFSLINTKQLSSRIRVQSAGHILGAVCVEVDRYYSGMGEKNRIVFSGDYRALHEPSLTAPKAPHYMANILVIECTYGDRLHEGRRIRRLHLDKLLGNAFTDVSYFVRSMHDVCSTC